MVNNIHYLKNDLCIDEVKIKTLVKEIGTPVYVYSQKQIETNYQSFDTAFAGVPHIICYALKANSNYAIGKLLFRNGAGADVASGGELYRALKSGFEPRKIVFAGVGKTESEIIAGLRNNILMFNMESVEEMQTIARIAQRLRKKAPVSFRYNPNIDPHTHQYITTGREINKFGLVHDQIIGAYKQASKSPWLDVVGIHCHIGSQITEIEPFVLESQRVYKVVQELNKIGINLKYIDLGGGLGIQYNNEIPVQPNDLAKRILPIWKPAGKTLIFEPGRYIVGNSGILVVRVLYRKQTGKKKFVIVDGGMSDLIRPALYDAYHKIIPVRKRSGRQVVTDIVGPICETGDFLAKARSFVYPEQDDLLAVAAAGAYGLSMSSQYNSRCRAAEVVVDGKNWQVIRDRETYKDLVVKEK